MPKRLLAASGPQIASPSPFRDDPNQKRSVPASEKILSVLFFPNSVGAPTSFNSDEPGCCTRSSIKLPVGHPPSGSCLDNALCPVSTQWPENRASCDARHSAGCSCSGVGWTLGVIMMNSPSTVFLYSIARSSGLTRCGLEGWPLVGQSRSDQAAMLRALERASRFFAERKMPRIFCLVFRY